jgi:hypothetical protein
MNESHHWSKCNDARVALQKKGVTTPESHSPVMLSKAKHLWLLLGRTFKEPASEILRVAQNDKEEISTTLNTNVTRHTSQRLGSRRSSAVGQRQNSRSFCAVIE